jgi:hypothetical protein
VQRGKKNLRNSNYFLKLIEVHKILKPAQTRWLSRAMVSKRILEQWTALLLFFKLGLAQGGRHGSTFSN